MSIDNERSSGDERGPRIATSRGRSRGPNRSSTDDCDEGMVTVPPPARLLAVFLVPLVLLMVWAFSQS